jgi:hypothetical protein
MPGMQAMVASLSVWKGTYEESIKTGHDSGPQTGGVTRDDILYGHMPSFLSLRS